MKVIDGFYPYYLLANMGDYAIRKSTPAGSYDIVPFESLYFPEEIKAIFYRLTAEGEGGWPKKATETLHKWAAKQTPQSASDIIKDTITDLQQAFKQTYGGGKRPQT